jgi:hypothetical protein
MEGASKRRTGGSSNAGAKAVSEVRKPNKLAAMWGGVLAFLVILLLPWPLYLIFSKGHYFNPSEDSLKPSVEEMKAIIYRSHDTSHEQEVSMSGHPLHYLEESAMIKLPLREYNCKCIGI